MIDKIKFRKGYAMKLKFFLIICIFLMSLVGLKAQAKNEFETGKIIPVVVCLDDKEQNYALYLPKAYDVSKKWPIIIGFSNAARGIDPVTLCSEAAEKFGFIVIGSNNTRNGPPAPIMKAYYAIKTEINKRFSIDSQRIYSIGLSGGSRVALQLAVIEPDLFRGVIACAGFIRPNDSYKNKKIFIYGMVGDKDVTYPEYKTGVELLKKTNTSVWIEVFKGGHQWPPKEKIFEAIEIFDYLYQKNGDDKGVLQANKIIKSKMAQIEQMMVEKTWEYALLETDNLLRNFENNAFIEKQIAMRKKIEANLAFQSNKKTE